MAIDHDDAIKQHILGIQPAPRMPVIAKTVCDLDKANSEIRRSVGFFDPPAPTEVEQALLKASGVVFGGDYKAAVIASAEANRAMLSSVAKLRADQKIHAGGRVDTNEVIGGISYSTSNAKLLAHCGSQFLYRRLTIPNDAFVVEQDARLEKSDGTAINATIYVLTPKELVNWIKSNARNLVDRELPMHLKALLPPRR